MIAPRLLDATKLLIEQVFKDDGFSVGNRGGDEYVDGGPVDDGVAFRAPLLRFEARLPFELRKVGIFCFLELGGAWGG